MSLARSGGDHSQAHSYKNFFWAFILLPHDSSSASHPKDGGRVKFSSLTTAACCITVQVSERSRIKAFIKPFASGPVQTELASAPDGALRPVSAASSISKAPIPPAVGSPSIFFCSPVLSSQPASLRELLGQLTFTTSSSKKRKISSRHAKPDQQLTEPSSPDSVLPSCEPDDEPALSFTTDSWSGPASSLPPRLQPQQGPNIADSPSSAASSPSGVADLSIESDRGGDLSGTETGSQLPRPLARSQSPFNVSRRAIMTGDADLPQRSSSPLKRRASSMEPDQDIEMKGVDSPAAPDASDAGDVASVRTRYPRAMSVDLPNGSSANHAQGEGMDANDHPPLGVQIKTIQTLVQAFSEEPLKVGMTGYAVSNTWLRKAMELGGDGVAKKTKTSDETLGPVDNSDIIQDIIELSDGTKFARLRPGTSMAELEFFPKDAWDLVVEWYGLKEEQVPIERRVINTALDASSSANIVFETNPPVFTVHRLWSAASGILVTKKFKEAPAVILVASSASPYNDVFKTLKAKAGIDPDRKMRVWSILPEPAAAPAEVEPLSALTPPESPSSEQAEAGPENWGKLVVSVDAFFKVDSSRRSKIDAVDHTSNPNYNGKSTLSMFSLSQDQILVLDEEVSKNSYVSTSFRRSDNEKAIARRAAQSNEVESGRGSPALSTRSGPVTRGRSQKKRIGRNVGVAGLNNLGNTCYMASALQCIRSVEELTKYFLVNEYKKEINANNPLGWGGQVASSYANLLRDLYTDGKSSVAPREFKNTIGRCRPTFSGWAQQDTQEFLGFLLDGLQEDLNRIEKKPYIEKPDSTDEMIGDDEAIRAMADKVWDITRKRDDSVIADLFTGMYKSTLECPVCHKVSITFDPFNNLTLPIPVADMWSAKIKFYPLNDVPVTFDVDLPKHSALSLVRKFISDRTGVPIGRLVGAEEYKSKFYKVYDDGLDVSEIASNDIGTYHELESVPTNFPSKPVPSRSMLDIDDKEPYVDPRTERLAVPIIHRLAKSHNGSDPLPPQFIVLTREEAENEDIIRRKVLEKVATLSTWNGFDEDEMVDPDTVITTQSDADSSGDGKVIAHSVQGEDDMVEVSMKDVDPKESSTPTSILREFNKKRPSWVDPKQHLPGQLQNLFELGFYSEGTDLPTGWQMAEKRELVPLSSRAESSSESSSEPDESNSPSTWTTGGDSDRESTSDQQSQASEPVHTRMNDESSDDAEPVKKPTKAHTRGKGMSRLGPNGRGKMVPNHKSFGKRANKRRNKELKAKELVRLPKAAPQSESAPGQSPKALVRYGELIIVEWNDDAFDTVFGKHARDDDIRGAKTFVEVEHVHDPALAKVRANRTSRRQNGCSLEECLDEFERAEVLSEHDEWYCPRCKEHRRASKKFDLWKSPDILVVHLKRFSSAGYRREKLDVLVRFPIEGLDLTTRVLNKENGKEEIFDLIAVDEHSGGLGGGHYTAVAKNFIDGRWYNFNDSHVSSADPESSITRMAYLLFYRRRSSQALGGKRFEEIATRFEEENNSEEDEDSDEQDMTEAGEGQRLGDGSYQNGSSRLGTGAGAIRPHDRGLASNTMSTKGQDDSLPSYDGGSSTIAGSDPIHNSIEEDEGIGMMENSSAYQPAQQWSFNSIGMGDGIPDGYASDDAQASDGPDLLFNDQSSNADPFGDNEQDRVIAVHAGDDDAASTEAAEIHLDDDDQQHSTGRT